MKCDEISDILIKSNIYKNKVVVFGDMNGNNKVEKFFKDNYNYQPIKINIYEMNNIIDCLVKKTGDNIIPKIFINGMYSGQYNDIERMHMTNDLDLIFKRII